MNIIEGFRSEVMQSTMSTGSMRKTWPLLQPALSAHVRQPIDPTKRRIFDLGDHLSEAFLSVGGARGQSDLGQAGVVWESLIVWYLNICLCGTDAVAFKGNKRFVARPIDKALTIKHHNVSLRSETDTLVVRLDNQELSGEANSAEEAVQKYKDILERHYRDINLINLQCKTNWNDIAQIPMLWNLVYSPTFRHNEVGVGMDGYTITGFRVFRYAFVTVPTQRKYKFTPTCLPVLRVRTCSGGNYWGKPTQNGVAFSIKEIFGLNQANNALPTLDLIGDGYANAVRDDSTEVDWQVYDLLL